MSEFDKKISALTSGTDSTATDEYVIARGGSNFKISGALVAAAATKVGTLASLAVTGDLTVDTSTLKVDAANNRVGIGTASPAYALEVEGNVNASVTVAVENTNAGTSAFARLLALGDAGNAQFGMTSSAYTDITGAQDAMLLNANNASGGIAFALDGTVKMKLDASGNVGIGVTPSAHSNGKAIEVGGLGNTVWGNGVSNFRLLSNAYFNSGFKYGGTGLASEYAQSDGIHTWSNAASGTAGNAVSFTERARITAGGYFKASNDGTYAGSTGVYHELRNNDAVQPVVYVTATNASTPTGIYVRFDNASPNNTTQYFWRGDDNASGGTMRVVAYSNGDLQNVNGVYGTISDAKLKQDIVDAGSSWDDLKAVRFRKYRFISDVEAKGEDAPYLLGVVAQELQVTSPGLVDSHPDTEKVEVEVEVEKSRPVMHEVEEVVTDAEGVESVVMKSVPMLDEEGKEITETYTETETRTETRKTGTETLSVKQSVLLMKAAVALQEAMARIESLEARLDALEN
jgi:hypothetical protein